MEITDVETVEFTYETRMTSDEKGHTHPGPAREATATLTRVVVDGGPDGICFGGRRDANEIATEHAVGEDPRDRELIWQRLHRAQRLNKGVLSDAALAAIDCALYDHAGKAAAVPVHKLLGGYRDEVPCYASTMVGDDDPDGLGTPGAYADFAEDLVEAGYPAVKLHSWMPPYDASPERNIELFRRVRERVGPEVDLMVDSHHFYSRTEAKRIGDALADLEYTWFEEPMDEHSMSAYEWLTDEVDVPIIGPETAEGKMRTRAEWIKRGIADISRVGVSDVGGLTPALKTVGLCASFNVPCELHGNGIPNMHLAGTMAIPGEYFEWGLLHPERDHDTGHAPWLESRPTPEDGVLELPRAPGLGYDVDWGFIEENRVEP